MKIRKSLIGVGAALMMVGASANDGKPEVCDLNNPVQEEITSGLVDLADYLSCEVRAGDPEFPKLNFGPWPADKPIWQKRGDGSCEVHTTLTRKLYERRDFAPGSKPPKKPNNDAAGAAWDVRNGKYDAAVEKLLSFKNDIRKSKLHSWDVAVPGFADTHDAKMFFLNSAEDALKCVCKLTECKF